MDSPKRDLIPPRLLELIRKAEELLSSPDSQRDGAAVVSVENLLRSAIQSEMDVARLRRLSVILSEFERFYLMPSGERGKDDAVIVIAETPMEARLTLVPARAGGAPLSPAQVLARVRSLGIAHGVQEDVVKAACEVASVRRETVYRLLVATGQPAEDGEDGSVSFGVKAFDKRMLIDPDSSFFGDLAALVEDVKAGTLVARITPATPGKPGRDVRGNKLPAVSGKPLSLAIGEGLQLQAEGREVYALGRGSLVVGDEALDLVPFHVVDGQVSVGQDVAFDGNVLVTGHVTGPVRIQARDILIAGNTEAASLSASGDIWVGGAIEGKATVEAEGRVFTRSVTDATVRAVGDVFVADAIVESRVASSGRVVARASRGRIEGGEVSAFRGVVAHTIGSAFGLPTTVRVGVQDLRGPLLAELVKRIRENVETLVKIDDLKGQFVGAGRSAVSLAPDHQALYISILRKEIQALDEIRGLRRRRQRLEAGREDGRPTSIAVTGHLHPPVTVEIGEGSEVIQEPLQDVVLTLGPDRKVVSGKPAAAKS
ncbi:MAG TPA: FapA family protein [Planctomycetota bacterium]